MMRLFKDTFAHIGEQCLFPKFHATLHYVQQLQQFGNLRLLDAGAGERQHKVWYICFLCLREPRLVAQDQVKKAFRLTSRLSGVSMLNDIAKAACLRDRAIALHEEIKVRYTEETEEDDESSSEAAPKRKRRADQESLISDLPSTFSADTREDAELVFNELLESLCWSVCTPVRRC